MADIRLVQPGAAQNLVVEAEEHGRIIFDFPAGSVTLSRAEGSDSLVLDFGEGASIEIKNFYVKYTKENMPEFEIDGQIVAGEEFFNAFGPDLSPAAGPSSSRSVQSGHYNEYANSNLMGGVNHLDGLDIGFENGVELHRTEATAARRMNRANTQQETQDEPDVPDHTVPESPVTPAGTTQEVPVEPEDETIQVTPSSSTPNNTFDEPVSPQSVSPEEPVVSEDQPEEPVVSEDRIPDEPAQPVHQIDVIDDPSDPQSETKDEPKPEPEDGQDPDSEVVASGYVASIDSDVLTSEEHPVTLDIPDGVTPRSGVYTGTYGFVRVDGDQITFTQTQVYSHAEEGQDTADGVETITVQGTLPDGREVQIPVSVSITDDVPSITVTSEETADYNSTITGSVQIDFGADGGDTVSVTVNDGAEVEGKRTEDGGYTFELNGETLTLSSDGTFSYPTPPSGKEATYTFAFTVKDADGDKDYDSTTVTLAATDTDISGKTINASDSDVTANTDSASDNDISHQLTISDDLPAGSVVQEGDYKGRYGDLHVDAEGTVSYTQKEAYRHAEGSENQEQAETFEVMATLADGTEFTVPVVINIKDDQPQAENDQESVNREDPVEINGNVLGNDDFGADGPSQPQAVTWASATSDAKYGTVTLNNDGSYSYTLDPDNKDVLALTSDTVLTEEFGYTITDADGDTSQAKLTITINGDNPVAPLNAEMTFNEANLPDGSSPVACNLTKTGEYVVSARDGIADVVIDDEVLVKDGQFTGEKILETSDGTLRVTGYNFDTETGTGKLTYEYVLEKANQNDSDEIKDGVQHNFTVTVTDRDGSTGTGSLAVNVVDDAPKANNDCDAVSEVQQKAQGNVVAGKESASGEMVGTDIPGADGFGSVQWDTKDFNNTEISDNSTLVHTEYGDLTIDSSGDYSFSLDTDSDAYKAIAKDKVSGEPGEVVLNVPYTVMDKDGDEATATLQIRITGSTKAQGTDVKVEDLEVKESGVWDADEVHKYQNQDAMAAANNPETVEGSAQFGQHLLTTNGHVTAGRDGDSLEGLRFTTRDLHGERGYNRLSGSEEEEIEVTAGMVEGAVEKYGLEANAVIGSFALNTKDGSYTFTLNDKIANPLAEDDRLAVSLPVTALSSDGGESTASVKITIHGTNDAPELTQLSRSELSLASGGENSQKGVASAQDVDLGDNASLEYRFLTGGTLAGKNEDGKTVLELYNEAGDSVVGTLWLDAGTGEYGVEVDQSFLNSQPERLHLGTSTDGRLILSSGEGEATNLTLRVYDQHDAHDEQTLTVYVGGENKTPVIEKVTDLVVKESGIYGENLGTADASYNQATVQDTDGELASNGSEHRLIVSGAVSATDGDSWDAGTLSYRLAGENEGQECVVKAAETAHGIEAGTEIGTFQIDAATGEYTFVLNDAVADSLPQGAKLTVTAPQVVAVDTQGVSSEAKDIHITIEGTNDKPEITLSAGKNSEEDTTGTGEETVPVLHVKAAGVDDSGNHVDGIQSASGTSNVSDVDQGDAHRYVLVDEQGVEANTFAVFCKNLVTGEYDIAAGSVNINTVTGEYTFTLNEGLESTVSNGIKDLAEGQLAHLGRYVSEKTVKENNTDIVKTENKLVLVTDENLSADERITAVDLQVRTYDGHYDDDGKFVDNGGNDTASFKLEVEGTRDIPVLSNASVNYREIGLHDNYDYVYDRWWGWMRPKGETTLERVVVTEDGEDVLYTVISGKLSEAASLSGDSNAQFRFELSGNDSRYFKWNEPESDENNPGWVSISSAPVKTYGITLPDEVMRVSYNQSTGDYKIYYNENKADILASENKVEGNLNLTVYDAQNGTELSADNLFYVALTGSNDRPELLFRTEENGQSVLSESIDVIEASLDSPIKGSVSFRDAEAVSSHTHFFSIIAKESDGVHNKSVTLNDANPTLFDPYTGASFGKATELANVASQVENLEYNEANFKLWLEAQNKDIQDYKYGTEHNGSQLLHTPGGDLIAQTVEGRYGTLTIDMNTGEYSYTLDPQKVAMLGKGECDVETFSLLVRDQNAGGHVGNAFDIKDISFSIRGLDDSYAYSAADAGIINATEDGAVPYQSDNSTGDLLPLVPAEEGATTIALQYGGETVVLGQIVDGQFTAGSLNAEGSFVPASEDVTTAVHAIRYMGQTISNEDGDLLTSGTEVGDLSFTVSKDDQGNFAVKYSFGLKEAEGAENVEGLNVDDVLTPDVLTGAGKLTLVAMDDNGDVLTHQKVHIWVHGANDGPSVDEVREGDQQSLGELVTADDDGVYTMSANALTSGGCAKITLSSSDVDGLDSALRYSGLGEGDVRLQTLVGEHGYLTIDDTSGTLEYHAYEAAANNYSGEELDTFTVAVFDDQGAQKTVTVRCSVQGTPDSSEGSGGTGEGPRVTAGEPDMGSVYEDGGESGDAPMVTEGTSQATGSSADSLIYNGGKTVIRGTYGTLILKTGDNGVTYEYRLDNYSDAVQGLYTGQEETDEFKVPVKIKGSGAEPGYETVSVKVNGLDDVPEMHVTQTLIAREGYDSVSVGRIFTHDADSNDALALSLSADGLNSYASAKVDEESGNLVTEYGTFSIVNDGTLTFEIDNNSDAVRALKPDEIRTIQVKVNAVDSLGHDVVKTVNVDILGKNTAPDMLFTNDGTVLSRTAEEAGENLYSVATKENTVLNGTLNVGDLDGTVEKVSVNLHTVDGSQESPTEVQTEYGTVSFFKTEDGTYSYSYTPNGKLAIGATADDSFTVKAVDDYGMPHTETITIHLEGTNEAPVIVSTSANKVAKSEVTEGKVSIEDPDDGDEHTLTAIIDGNEYTVTDGAVILEDGQLSFTPNAEGSGWSYTFTPSDDALVGMKTDASVAHDVRLVVTDTQGESATTEVVTIGYSGTNAAPSVGVISGGDDNVSTQGNTVTLTMDTTDGSADGPLTVSTGNTALRTVDLDSHDRQQGADTLTYTFDGADAHGARQTVTGRFGTMTFDSTTGNVSYEVSDAVALGRTYANGGDTSEQFTFTVKDTLDQSSTGTVKVNVRSGETEGNTEASESQYIFGGEKAEVIQGGSGDDVLSAGSGDDILYGGAGDDFLFGGHGGDVLDGNSGDDYIDGGSGADKLYGSAGDDTVIYDGNDLIVDGGTGFDVLVGKGSVGALLDRSTDAGQDNVAGFEAALDIDNKNIENLGGSPLAALGVVTASTDAGTRVLMPSSADGWDAGHYETAVDNTSYVVFKHRTKGEGDSETVDATLAVATTRLVTAEELLPPSVEENPEELLPPSVGENLKNLEETDQVSSNGDDAFSVDNDTLVGRFGTLTVDSLTGEYSYTANESVLGSPNTVSQETFVITVTSEDGTKKEIPVTVRATVNGEGEFQYTSGSPEDFIAVSNTGSILPSATTEVAKTTIASITVKSEADDAESVKASLSAGDEAVKVSGRYGTVSVDASGTYTYTADADSVQEIGGVAEESFSFTVTTDENQEIVQDVTVRTAATGDKTVTLTGRSELFTVDSNTPAVIQIAEDDASDEAGALIMGTADADSITGTSGSDTIYGGAGSDTIYAGDGDDFIDGGAGKDRLFGGNEENVVTANDDSTSTSDPVDEESEEGTGDSAGEDLVLPFAEEGADAALTSDGNDVFVYDSEDEVVNGGSGIDYLVGTDSLDALLGTSTSEEPTLNDVEFGIGVAMTSIGDLADYYERYGINSTVEEDGEEVVTLGDSFEPLAPVEGQDEAVVAFANTAKETEETPPQDQEPEIVVAKSILENAL